MPPLRNLPFPYGEPISRRSRPGYKPGTDPQEGLVSLAWINAFTALLNQVNSIPVTSNSISKIDQTGSVAATNIVANGKLNTGTYRLSWWYGVTAPATISSALQFSFDYSYRGIAKTFNGINLVGNTTAESSANGTEPTVVFLTVDGNTPVRYTVTYASVGIVQMFYDFFICLEQVPL